MCDLAQPRVRLFGRANTVRSHKRREAACGGGQGNERSGTASVASLSPGTANPDARAFFRRLSCDRRLPLPADKSSQGLARAYFAVRVRVSPSLFSRDSQASHKNFAPLCPVSLSSLSRPPFLTWSTADLELLASSTLLLPQTAHPLPLPLILILIHLRPPCSRFGRATRYRSSTRASS